MKKVETLPKPADSEDLAAMLRACGDTWEGIRNQSLMYTYFDGGARRTEALRLMIKDVRLRDQLIFVGYTKTGAEDYLHMGDKAARAMRRWLTLRYGAAPQDILYCKRDGAPLHPDYISTLLTRLCEKAGLDRVWRPHSFRHYCGTYIWRRTGDVKLVQRILRHKDPTMANFGYRR